VLEILYMPRLNRKNFRDFIEIDHLERMQEAIAEGHGVVVLTGHIGTWEWLSAAFTMNDLPVTAIAKPQPNMQFTYALDALRKTIEVQIFSRGTSELMAAARALKAGKILGAGLDVFAKEPLPADSPLIGLDNVILTPHVSSQTWESLWNIYARAIDIAADYLEGKDISRDLLNADVLK